MESEFKCHKHRNGSSILVIRFGIDILWLCIICVLVCIEVSCSQFQSLYTWYIIYNTQITILCYMSNNVLCTNYNCVFCVSSVYKTLKGSNIKTIIPCLAYLEKWKWLDSRLFVLGEILFLSTNNLSCCFWFNKTKLHLSRIISKQNNWFYHVNSSKCFRLKNAIQ